MELFYWQYRQRAQILVVFPVKNDRVLAKKSILSVWWGAQSATTKVSRLSNDTRRVYFGE